MSNCVFCGIATKKLPASIVHEDDLCVAIMDIFPMRPGHVLVIPKVHQQYVAELNAELRAHLFEVANKVSIAVRSTSLKPDAVHFAINDGVAAHQTVPHVHMHVLPRQQGDRFKLLAAIAKKPLQLILGPTKRTELEKLAAEIKAEF